MRSGGKPACSATCSSPPVATSRSETLLGDEPRHRDAEERLARVRDARAETARSTRGTGRRSSVLVVDVQRRAERRRRARRGRRRRARRARASTDAERGSSDEVERRGHASASSARSSSRRAISSGACTPRSAERVGEADPARLGQPQPGLGELGVVGEHAAVAVEAVERAREVAHPRRDLLRRARLRGLVRRRRDTARARAAARPRARARASARSTVSSGRRATPVGRGLAADRRDPRVRVLHVVDGILHRLRGDDVEIERLRRVDALQQERHARDVGIDLVEDVGERDDVAGPLRDADLVRRRARASRTGRG